MGKLKKVILCFCMSFFVFINSSVCVFASDLNDGVNDGFDRYMGGTNIKGFNSWEVTDKKSLFATNIGTFFAEIGMYFKGQSNQTLLNIFTEHLIETNRIENADSLDSYIASHLTANDEESELYMSTDLTNSLHETAIHYIEEETGWYTLYSFTPSQMLPKISNQQQYETLCSLCDELKSDEVLLFMGSKSYNGSYYPAFMVVKTDGFLFSGNQWVGHKKAHSYYKWVTSPNYTEKAGYIMNDGSIEYAPDDELYNNDGTAKNFIYGASYSFLTDDFSTASAGTSYLYYLRSTHTPYRVYKSIDDYKAYSIGQRPYYVTDAFNNYDSTVDNSTTITQTEIDNSVTYGDVYNYITNNYENPDGLTEDELRAILAEYLSTINNNNSGGGSGGSDNGSGSGGGLGGFLDGLGSIGNAILAILGKLMEILGSAIELITGAITDLITIIPNSIGELLGALFPVFPEEWIKAITLSLVLGVIVGIVRMFK